MRKLFILPLLLLLTACPVAIHHDGGLTKSDQGFIHAKTGFTYPATIDSFAVVANDAYDASGVHYSVGYNDNDDFIAITIYLYPKTLYPEQYRDLTGLQKIELAEITHFHPNAKLVKDEAIDYGGNFKGIKKTFNYNEEFAFGHLQFGKSDLVSELYLMQGTNSNLKFRITYKADQAAKNTGLVESFINKWIAANRAVKF